MVNQQINLIGVATVAETLQKLIHDDDNQANWEFSKNISAPKHYTDYFPCTLHFTISIESLSSMLFRFTVN